MIMFRKYMYECFYEHEHEHAYAKINNFIIADFYNAGTDDKA